MQFAEDVYGSFLASAQATHVGSKLRC
jgi:hypothetical protein